MTTVPVRRQASARDLVRVAGVAFLVLGLIGTAGGVVLGWSQYQRVRDWPTTQAKVLSSQVYTRTASRGSGTAYGARYMVEYSVGGSVFHGALDRGYLSSMRWPLEIWAKKYPAGSEIPIRYNPGSPWQIVPGGSVYETLAGPVIFLEAGGCGVLLGILLVRVNRRRKEAA